MADKLIPPILVILATITLLCIFLDLLGGREWDILLVIGGISCLIGLSLSLIWNFNLHGSKPLAKIK
jgi:hypothetical protein